MKYFFLFFILLVLAPACKKEPGAKPIEVIPGWTIYTTSNSILPDNQVNAIAIGKNDTKWIGTANGLARIQEGKWTVFTTGNSPLPSGYITSLAVEESGLVWVGTDKGLASYNGEVWSVYTTQNSVLGYNCILSMIYDAGHKITYIGTEGDLVKVENKNQFTLLEDTGNPILSLATDKHGALWVGTFNYFAFAGRIKKLENGLWSGFSLPDLGYPSAFPYALAIDKNNHALAVLSGTSSKTVARINNTVFEEIAAPENAGGLKALLVEGDKIWVAGKCLSVFGDKQSPCLSIPGTDSPIQAIAIDRKGYKWLGTFYGGIAVYHE